MSKKLVRKLMATMSGAGLLVLLAAWDVQAFELGIDLDEFLVTVEGAMVGVGMLAFVIGGVGMVVAKMENAYGQFFSGYLNLFMNGGILGGLVTIGGFLGLVSGALLVVS